MKPMRIIPILISLLFIACKESKNAAVVPPGEPQKMKEVKNDSPLQQHADTNAVGVVDPAFEREVTPAKSEVNESIMGFIVSFYSIGEGIDRGEPEKLLAFVESFEKKSGNKIQFSKIHWGREGETDFCFPLIGLPGSLIMDFKSGMKNALKSARHVHFLENQACRKGR